MPYIRSPSVTGSRARRRRAAGGMGADDSFTQGTGSGVPAGVDPTMYLIAQVNRFMGPQAPAKLKLGDTPLPLASGELGIGPATFAVVIMDYRTQEKYADDPSANDRIKRAYADPVGFVKQNMKEVASTIQTYGDVLGAPPAQFPGAPMSSNVSIAVALLLGAGALYLFTRKKR